MSCAPNQAEYIDVTQYTPSTAIKPDAQYMVTELTYYVSNKFSNDTFNSCKDVQFPSASAKVITTMCGGHGSDCTPQLFLSYLGTKDPSPMQIDFFISNDTSETNGTKTFTPMNSETVSCSAAPQGYSNNSCNCVDCPVKCAPKPYPKPEKPWIIWGIDGMWLIMGFIYYGLVIILSAAFIFYYYKRNNGLFSSFLNMYFIFFIRILILWEIFL